MRAPRGFTLIELLVVIGVIAVLVAIVFPAYSAIRRSQKIKRTEQLVQTLATAAASYANDYGMYPPADYAAAGPNRGNRSLITLLDARGGQSWPYLPSPFYDGGQHIEGDLFLDEWGRPVIYFDSSTMTDETSHTYAIEGDTAVSPARGDDGYVNFGRCQVWSVGPNGRNEGGLGLGTKEADDIANFDLRPVED
ncbi:MAG: type II secretion system protein [Planctomycetota bacterium]